MNLQKSSQGYYCNICNKSHRRNSCYSCYSKNLPKDHFVEHCPNVTCNRCERKGHIGSVCKDSDYLHNLRLDCGCNGNDIIRTTRRRYDLQDLIRYDTHCCVCKTNLYKMKDLEFDDQHIQVRCPECKERMNKESSSKRLLTPPASPRITKLQKQHKEFDIPHCEICDRIHEEQEPCPRTTCDYCGTEELDGYMHRVGGKLGGGQNKYCNNICQKLSYKFQEITGKNYSSMTMAINEIKAKLNFVSGIDIPKVQKKDGNQICISVNNEIEWITVEHIWPNKTTPQDFEEDLDFEEYGDDLIQDHSNKEDSYMVRSETWAEIEKQTEIQKEKDQKKREEEEIERFELHTKAEREALKTQDQYYQRIIEDLRNQIESKDQRNNKLLDTIAQQNERINTLQEEVTNYYNLYTGEWTCTEFFRQEALMYENQNKQLTKITQQEFYSEMEEILNETQNQAKEIKLLNEQNKKFKEIL